MNNKMTAASPRWPAAKTVGYSLFKEPQAARHARQATVRPPAGHRFARLPFLTIRLRATTNLSGDDPCAALSQMGNSSAARRRTNPENVGATNFISARDITTSGTDTIGQPTPRRSKANASLPPSLPIKRRPGANSSTRYCSVRNRTSSRGQREILPSRPTSPSHPLCSRMKAK
jgi:hypothetical protein